VPDDILDAAQKAINDAAKSADGSAVGQDKQEASPAPSTVPTQPSGATSPVTPPEPPEPEPIAPIPPVPVTPTEETPAKSTEPTPPPAKDASTDKAKEEVMNTILGGSDVVAAAPAVSEPHAPEAPSAPPKGTKPVIPNKKKGKGVILGIIVTLLLTLPVAVYYISQQNQQLADLRGRAWLTGYQGCSANGGGDNGQGSCPAGYVCHCQDGNACTETKCEPLSETEGPCRNQGRAWCDNAFGNGWTCCYRGYECGPNNEGCIPRGDDNGDDDDDTTNPTATPTTGIAPVCQNIKIYKGGQQVTNLSSLRAGDDVTLAVKGNLAPSKAHFRVNGVQLTPNDGDSENGWTVTTTKNNANEWTKAYTIPSGVTDFVIEGEVFTNGAYR